MKITTLFVLAACLQVSAKGFSQNITYSGTNVPLTTVFSVIEKQTSYNVVYNPDWLDKAKTVSVVANNVPVETFLRQTLKDLPFDFSIQNTTIILSRKPVVSNSYQEIPMAPPPFPISGRVTNGDGNPLSGASVTNKTSKVSVATDADGRFSLNSNEGDVLAITYVGFSSIQLRITSSTTAIVVSSDRQSSSGTDDDAITEGDGSKSITYRVGQTLSFSSGLNIVLSQKISTLNEVVINKGYYTEKKKFSTGNTATITSKEIEQQPVQNPLLALQGRVPGIQITQLTGMPGGAVTVRIQGQNSINSGLDPLIVIDGVPFPPTLLNSNLEGVVQGGSPLSYINPNDIESIDILKDADATAIYGSRAGNGAIIITTKKGKIGKSKFNVNLQQGWGQVGHFVDMMNTRQYLDMRYEALRNDGISIVPASNYDLTVWDTTRYTNWQKTLIGGTAKYTNINADVSGGSANIQYLMGGTFNRQTTVFPGDFDDKRAGLHFNVGVSSNNQRLKIQLSSSYMYDQNHLQGIDLTQQALLLEPDAPALYNANGSLNWNPNAAGTSTWTNPLVYTLYSDYTNTTKSLISNLNLTYNILPGLDFRSSFGYNNMQTNMYLPFKIEANAPEKRANSQRRASYGFRSSDSWIIEPQLQYRRIFGKGKLEGLLGTSIQKATANVLYIGGSGYSSDLLMKSLLAAQSVFAGSSAITESKFNSLFGRLNYIWNEKYIMNLTARRDGSSKFGDANKLHNFGSVGLGWIFSQEKLIQSHLPFLSFGKLRGSYGTTGNDQIGDFGQLSTYGIINPPIQYQGVGGLQATGIPNPHLQWEETKKLQGGVDLGFLSNRINIGMTYARNRSTNQLISYIIPSTTGFIGITENLPALIQNTSWEFTFNASIIKTTNLLWTTSFNLTVPKNELMSFPGIENTAYASGENGIIIGQPIGVIKAYRFSGVDPSTGKYQVYDKDGNSTTTPNGITDRTELLGNFTKYYGGMQQSVSYKGFQLDANFQFVYKKGPDDFSYFNGYNAAYAPGSFLAAGTSNQPVTVLNHWQKSGDNVPIGRYSSLRRGLQLWPVSSDVWYTYKASYIRLKNLSLSWQVPRLWIQKASLQNCLIYFRGENLFTFTKYHGLDPESGSSTLPPLRMMTVGIQLGL